MGIDPGRFFRIGSVSSKVISCDHCEAEIRIDWDTENRRTSEASVDQELRAKAIANGWGAKELRSRHVMNLCPDHVSNYKEMDLI